MSKIKFVFSVFLVVVLFIFAFLQYNDPDALLWITVYGVVGVVGISSLLGKTPQILYPILITALVSAAFFSWPDQYVGLQLGDGDWKLVELARESLGLIFCGICTGYFWWVKPKYENKKPYGQPKETA